MLNKRTLSVAALLLCLSSFAMAAAPQSLDANTVLGFVKQSIEPAMSKLSTLAIKWLGVLAVLQFFITNYKLLLGDSDISSIVGKAVSSLAWVGFIIYLIQNGPEFIQGVGDQMFNALGLDMPKPVEIIGATILAAGSLLAAALTTGVLSSTGGMILTYLGLFVLAVGMLFAFKIFMLHLEIALVAMLAPLSFAFLGLSALRDQGIAPFKALVSLIYRIILLTIILSAFTKVSDILSTTINSFGDIASPKTVINSIISALGAYLLLAYLTFKSDSIAATLASGSTSLGTGDVAQAAATGAALGAAVASGGAAAAAAGGKAPQSMSDFMGKMMGGGGSISNASPMGGGGDSTPSFTPPRPSLSAGASGSGAKSPATSSATPGAPSNKPPSRPQSDAAAAPQKTPSVASGRYGPGLPEEAQSNASPAPQGAQDAQPPGAGSGAEQATQTPAGEQTNSDSGGPSQGASLGTPEGAPGKPADNAQTSSTQSAPPASTPGAGAAPQQSAGTSAGQPASSSPTAAQGEQVTVVPSRSESAHSNSTQESGAGPADPAPGSGLSAEVGGQKSALESDLSKLVGHLSSQGPRKPSLGERLGEANRNVSQEQAATHISINTHQSD